MVSDDDSDVVTEIDKPKKKITKQRKTKEIDKKKPHPPSKSKDTTKPKKVCLISQPFVKGAGLK